MQGSGAMWGCGATVPCCDQGLWLTATPSHTSIGVGTTQGHSIAVPRAPEGLWVSLSIWAVERLPPRSQISTWWRTRGSGHQSVSRKWVQARPDEMSWPGLTAGRPAATGAL